MVSIGETAHPRISVRNLWKIFGPNAATLREEEWVQTASQREVQEETSHVIAMKDLSFDVGEGEVFVVMGLSGSGKSTLVRCLLRLIEPTSGSIKIDDEEIVELGDKELIQLRRKKFGMIFQHYGLLPHRKVLENVAYGLEVQGIDKATRNQTAWEVLGRVGLDGWSDAYPDELSGGMQQRVGIARALALDPPILLMDEPFSGLDPLIRREMQDELISLQEQVKKTIVFITHDLNEALKLGSHIAILRNGEIVQLGTPEQIVMSPADDYVAQFVQDVSKAKVLAASSIMEEPQTVIYEEQGLAECVQTMESNEMKHAFVVTPDRVVRSVVRLEDAVVALGAGDKSLSDIANHNFPKCGPDTLVEELVALAAQYDGPILVAGSSGELLGEVKTNAILRSMASLTSGSADNS
ncbi:MAG: glycine betaine/L-proline ABC transporter ATP-binding protein [Chloroflexota bacterium]|nr:glycine betaine/L-proline ABC transporter ATP-binding protein [Chloroflexota bacterium]